MNTPTKYVIIGGGITGTAAAGEIRKRDPQGKIMLFEREPHRLYSRVMLSKPPYFLGKVPPDTVFLRKPEWYEQNAIDFRPGTEVVAIRPTSNEIETGTGETIPYDKLLLATGVCASPWNVEGSDKEGVYMLRTLEDAKKIIAGTTAAKSGMAIGGGFIGFEVCDLFCQKKMETTIVIREPYFWGLLWDEVSGRLVEEAMVNGGVRMVKNDEVVSVKGVSAVTGVTTKQGADISTDLIVVGIGVTCHLDFIRTSGITVNRGIRANEFLQTNIENIWTAGDAAEYTDVILNEQVILGNWTHAQMQGLHVARNMTGEQKPYVFVSSYKTTGFGTSIAFVGDVRVTEGRDVLVRQDKEGTWITRILFEKDEIVGATMVNRATEVTPISSLIIQNVKVSSIADQLADASVPLTQVVQTP